MAEQSLQTEFLPSLCSSVTGLEAGQGCNVKARDPLCLSDAKCDPGKQQCSECLSFLFLLALFRAVRVMHGLIYYCFRGTDGCDDRQILSRPIALRLT